MTSSSPSPVLVRFAPSPTGRLHLGNARIAVANALFARARGGALILRMDDTDTARSTEAYAAGIREDLRWLGIDWVREETQLSRIDRYTGVLAALRANGRLYPCYETAEELEAQRRRLRARGLPPVYDRSALALSAERIVALEAEGRRPHWRFLLEHTDTEWIDLVRGPCRYNGAHLSDPVLVREDGGLLYTLPSVVDDLDFGITHVIRGEDHAVNTAVQIQLIRALGGAPPRWAHLPLVLAASGEPLSKRDGALSLAGLRAEGVEPAAIVALMATLGTGEAPDPLRDLDETARHFHLDAFGRSAPRLDPADLFRLSARVVHHLSWPEAEARGASTGPAAWAVIRENLQTFADVDLWQRVIEGPLTPVADADDRPFLEAAARLLPPPPWDGETWARWTADLKAETGRKGRALFLPLRRALTGLDHGPDMKDLLPLIAPDTVRSRLGGAAP